VALRMSTQSRGHANRIIASPGNARIALEFDSADVAGSADRKFVEGTKTATPRVNTG
jgi:hypothetical protein